jgi:hypothetical protein
VSVRRFGDCLNEVSASTVPDATGIYIETTDHLRLLYIRGTVAINASDYHHHQSGFEKSSGCDKLFPQEKVHVPSSHQRIS